MALVSQQHLKQFKRKASDLLNRSFDHHINLAVTGLSRSGKTAFITSLVNQLINEGSHSQLDFFNVVHRGDYIAAKRIAQKNLHIGRFEYDKAMQALTAQPPEWPEPTSGISELRLAVRYQPRDSLIKYATDAVTLTIDITDYPGEWLLDLPLLNMTYEQWSEFTVALMEQAPRAEYSSSFLNKVRELDPFAEVNEQQLADLAHEYTNLLKIYRYKKGLSVIQPGRFILPGDLADAPILQFFPYAGFSTIDINEYQNATDSSLIGMLRARFLEYKERVVKKFYQQHFVRFDRQIILADCLTPLNNGAESFEDLAQAINLIMESFNYGQSSLFRRLFSPRIDKLMFAATKSDHVTPEQHSHLTSLLNQLVYDAKKQLSFEDIEMKTVAIASVKATQVGKAQHQGKDIPVLRGKRVENNELITVFPGVVPAKLPDQKFWQNNTFKFINFAPLSGLDSRESLPHIRMDQVLQFLLGDKIK
ncbi:YcjX family protein [Thalassotalea ganghwensis]